MQNLLKNLPASDYLSITKGGGSRLRLLLEFGLFCPLLADRYQLINITTLLQCLTFFCNVLHLLQDSEYQGNMGR